MMDFSEIAGFLWKCGYNDREFVDHHRTFYEYDTMDFLYTDNVKKFEFDYKDGKVDEITMTQYIYGQTIFKTIKTVEELYDSI